MDNVLNFIILEQVYKDSLKRQWSSGDRFQSFIDDQYWSGTILKQSPFSKCIRNSVWQSYLVLWESGGTDRLNPWELHPPEINGDKDFNVNDRNERLNMYLAHCALYHIFTIKHLFRIVSGSLINVGCGISI